MKNFLLRFLLPPAHAVILILSPALITDGLSQSAGQFLLIYLLYAYVFAGLPALAFAGLMGRLQRRGFRHGGIRLLTAALLGLMAGLLITIPFGIKSAVIFLPLGLGVGLLVELTVIALERRPNPHP